MTKNEAPTFSDAERRQLLHKLDMKVTEIDAAQDLFKECSDLRKLCDNLDAAYTRTGGIYYTIQGNSLNISICWPQASSISDPTLLKEPLTQSVIEILPVLVQKLRGALTSRETALDASLTCLANIQQLSERNHRGIKLREKDDGSTTP